MTAPDSVGLRQRAEQWLAYVTDNPPASVQNPVCDDGVQLVRDLLTAWTAVETERDELKADRQERCSQHPADPLMLVCAECFESEKTAAATERAEVADAEIAGLLRLLREGTP